MGSQLSMHILRNRNKGLLSSATQNREQRTSKPMAMDVKTKLAEDMRKITNVASRLKIGGKKKDKVAQTVSKEDEPVANSFKMTPPASSKSPSREEKRPMKTSEEPVTTTSQVQTSRPELLPNKVQLPRQRQGLPHHIVAATRLSERKWTLSDLLHSLGSYVCDSCSHLYSAPMPNEVAMWVRCADRALQLNGWTINSFLLESHIVFTYMLIESALKNGYELRVLADVKELVLMCLYISYTYNANEISYPLRPFLVKQNRAAFWDKCTSVSLNASSSMLRLNRDRSYYNDVLSSLKQVTTTMYY